MAGLFVRKGVYAHLVPEEMRDSVEFGWNSGEKTRKIIKKDEIAKVIRIAEYLHKEKSFKSYLKGRVSG
jgi:hypothetical protein